MLDRDRLLIHCWARAWRQRIPEAKDTQSSLLVEQQLLDPNCYEAVRERLVKEMEETSYGRKWLELTDEGRKHPPVE